VTNVANANVQQLLDSRTEQLSHPHEVAEHADLEARIRGIVRTAGCWSAEDDMALVEQLLALAASGSSSGLSPAASRTGSSHSKAESMVGDAPLSRKQFQNREFRIETAVKSKGVLF